MALSAVLALASTGATAQEAVGADSAIQPATTCASLTSADLSAVDAVVTSAAAETREGHDFCFVEGYVSPQTQFEMLLPLTSWKGQYLQQGCGGFCGFLGVSLKDPSRTSAHQAPWAPLLNGEVVVAASNNGHYGGGTPVWAKNDPRLRVEYGYGSEHALAQAAKAVIQAFYGQEPAHSYFDGVSDGGREALVLAQRFPEDFDGILAGAPGSNWAPFAGMASAWMVHANLDDQGQMILTSEKLPALHAAVMNACANNQGVIEDPRACTFDPVTIQCEAGRDEADCLTAEEVDVVRKLYRGATDAEGRNLYNGGQPYGSELAWNIWLIQPDDDTQDPDNTYAGGLALGHLRYMASLEDGAEDLELSEVEFTAAEHARLQEFGAVYNANDPDLTTFRDAGGKLIVYHGWADEGISPFSTVDYYRAVVETMDGFDAAQTFSRLYMIPGLYHCPCGNPELGDPATEVQFMDELVDWVENDQAPGVKDLPVIYSSAENAPASLQVAPFDPTLPAPDNDGLNSNYDYVGRESDYQPGNALWCEQQGATLACTSNRANGEP
jgi:feruloyl esterase